MKGAGAAGAAGGAAGGNATAAGAAGGNATDEGKEKKCKDTRPPDEKVPLTEE